MTNEKHFDRINKLSQDRELKTEFKKIKNLYFIGEVLDLDAVTGGYNLQIAWSTAYLAATDVCRNKQEDTQ